MWNVFKKSYAFKILVIFMCGIIVIEYKFSVVPSSLYFRGNIQRYIVIGVSTNNTIPHAESKQYNITNLPPPGYLVWNDHCRMPNIDPFTEEGRNIFEKKDYTLCSDKMPLTNVLFDINSKTYSLHIDEYAKQMLVDDNDEVSCCYQSVLRSGSGDQVDKEYKLKDCVPFYRGYVLPPDVDGLIIRCESVRYKDLVQKDAHYLVREKPEVRQRLEALKRRAGKNRPISVLLMGIDSLSRFNLRRTMPETAARLVNDNWFELSGYNKIGDNTFPNVMAFLSGYNMTTAYSKCNLPTEGGLDDCNIIWDHFRKLGYVTGYAEDETWISTFDYVLKGFKNVPVDYYHRPFMIAIEKNLKIKKLADMNFCAGLRHSTEYIYDFALDFATRYQGEPYFGLFWTNTFTHNAFDGAPIMDTRIAQYIEEMKERGILDDSIVIFVSDHGARYGKLRNLKQGFLEERLPLVFIWLPPWFRTKYPNFVEALKINRYRLTNPYDLHMTLEHILELSGRTEKIPQAVGCPNCQSLFFPIPEQRSCKDIAIDEHWCTCIPYENVETQETVIVDGVSVVLNNLNLYLTSGNFSPPCLPLELKSINEAQIKVDLDSKANPDIDVYRIRFTVKSQEAKFEASLSYSKTSKTYEIFDSVSRLDSYEEASKCIQNKIAKKYCICFGVVVKKPDMP